MNSNLYHLIFIDDDKDFLNSMSMTVTSKLLKESDGFEIESHFVSNPNEGLAFAQELTDEEEKIAVIISDQQMPLMTGIEFIEKANKIVPKAIKMLLTGHASLDSAKYAINHQILDQYVSKPIEDYDHFISLIKNAIQTFHLREEKERAELEIRRYVYELEQSNERIRSMHSAAEKIAYLAQGFKKLDLDEVFDLIINRLPSIFNAQYSSLFLLNEEENCLQMVRSNYLDEPFRKPLDGNDESPMIVALRRNEILVVPEIKQAPYDFLHKNCLGKSCIIIPFLIGSDENAGDILGASEGLKGVLNLGNIINMDSEDIVNYAASLIRNILGINILNARLYQKTQRLAIIDSLTGLYNKHIFMEFLRKECDYCERHGVPFYMSIFDVDDFKAINDTHGHRIGDEVLNQLGLILRSSSRKSDIVARFGGEEFSCIIHEDDEESIIAFLDRIRMDIFHSKFPASIRLSISIGVTRYYPKSQDNVEKLIDRADKALYQAKNNGKNMVEVSFIHEATTEL